MTRKRSTGRTLAPREGAQQLNEGEGNRTAARQYNEQQREFVRSGRVNDAAKEAERAVRGPEREELLRDEATGRSRART